MSTLTCSQCRQSLQIQCQPSNDVLQGLKAGSGNVTVYQFALPGQPSLTPALCGSCHSTATAPYPPTALCYVCETHPIQDRYKFLVSFGYMGLNVYTLLCSVQCRARHEIYARQDFADNGGHLQIVNDPQLAAEIEGEILRLQSNKTKR